MLIYCCCKYLCNDNGNLETISTCHIIRDQIKASRYLGRAPVTKCLYDLGSAGRGPAKFEWSDACAPLPKISQLLLATLHCLLISLRRIRGVSYIQGFCTRLTVSGS